jgi:hypothetical protein
MRRIAMVVVALVLAGCGGGGDSLEKLKTDVCACKDARCIEGLLPRLAKWERQLEAKNPPSDAEQKLMAEIDACLDSR